MKADSEPRQVRLFRPISVLVCVVLVSFALMVGMVGWEIWDFVSYANFTNQAATQLHKSDGGLYTGRTGAGMDDHVYIYWRPSQFNATNLAETMRIARTVAEDNRVHQVFLHLHCSGIGDSHVEMLAGVKKLQSIELCGTMVTQEGINQLRNAYPLAKIDTNDCSRFLRNRK